MEPIMLTFTFIFNPQEISPDIICHSKHNFLGNQHHMCICLSRTECSWHVGNCESCCQWFSVCHGWNSALFLHHKGKLGECHFSLLCYIWCWNLLWGRPCEGGIYACSLSYRVINHGFWHYLGWWWWNVLVFLAIMVLHTLKGCTERNKKIPLYWHVGGLKPIRNN